MEVSVTHHIDSSEADGYHYEYHLFRFTKETLTFVVRSYLHSNDEAHFLSLQDGLKIRSLSPEDLESPLFQESVQYLREAGKTSVNWLAQCGYTPA